MTYLGIDVDGAARLVEDLRQLCHRVEPVLDRIGRAEVLASLHLGVDGPLDQLAYDCRVGAAAVAAAVAELKDFRIQLRDTPPRGLSDGVGGSTPWNEVHQVASHNSYAVAGGIAALYDEGVRAFELDIHRGAPAPALRAPYHPWLPTLAELVVDHLLPVGDRSADWRVYHHSAGPHSEYHSLSEALDVVAALGPTEPITLFVDNKDAFSGVHDAAAFDALLERHVGERLFRPSDLRARVPGATTVAQSIATAGWPTTAELNGRLVVVITDNTDGYDRRNGSAFIAPPPVFETVGGNAVLATNDEVVFYNADHRRLRPGAVEAIVDSGAMLRTYFGPRCDPGIVGRDRVEPNYRAVDIAVGDAACPGPSPAPVDTPVPIASGFG